MYVFLMSLSVFLLFAPSKRAAQILMKIAQMGNFGISVLF